MKTLEPIPVTTDRAGNRYYVWGDTVVPPSTADSYVEFKRLEPGELAAEYWRAGDDMAETNYDRDVNAEPIRQILARFATRPNASSLGYE